MSFTPKFTPGPPAVDSHILISFPSQSILLVTLNRPKSMNCISTLGSIQLSLIWAWYDATPSLRCAIVTGATHSTDPLLRRSFCAGADLKEWHDIATTESTSSQKGSSSTADGFGGLSSRRGKKPIISAVHGVCLGGGFEMVANTDLIVAHESSVFSLPEVTRGIAPIAGILPRLVLTVGMQRASELAFTGRVLTAREAMEWGIVNQVVNGDEDVVDVAIVLAKRISKMSPDSIIVSREALRAVYDGDGVDAGMNKIREGAWQRLQSEDNIEEGLRAFVEKRDPVWVDSKL